MFQRSGIVLTPPVLLLLASACASPQQSSRNSSSNSGRKWSSRSSSSGDRRHCRSSGHAYRSPAPLCARRDRGPRVCGRPSSHRPRADDFPAIHRGPDDGACAAPPRVQGAEVGTGSGYQAAVLAEIVDSVFTIEILGALATAAQARLRQLNYANIEVREGDGYNGWPEHAPFDAILVTALRKWSRNRWSSN